MCKIETLFCTEACKRANKGGKSKNCLRVFTIIAVSTLFLTNVYGVALVLILHLGSPGIIIMVAIYCYLLLIAGASYFRMCFADPGYLKERRTLTRQCSICKMSKPARSHHCSQCNRCVVRMDHHCPWIARCVGAENYGEFVKLLISAILCFTFSLVPLVTSFFIENSSKFLQFISSGVSGFITIIFDFLVIKLLVFHARLIKTNQTTIEFYENITNRMLNPLFKHYYDEGVSNNVRQVVPNPWLILVPFVKINCNFPENGFYTYDAVSGRELLADDQQKLEDVIGDERPTSKGPRMDVVTPALVEEKAPDVDMREEGEENDAEPLTERAKIRKKKVRRQKSQQELQ